MTTGERIAKEQFAHNLFLPIPEFHLLARKIDDAIVAAVAAERKACEDAVLAVFDRGPNRGAHPSQQFLDIWGSGIMDAADAIRARGQEKQPVSLSAPGCKNEH